MLTNLSSHYVGHTPNQYLDFGDNISLLGMIKYFEVLCRAQNFEQHFICCFGDIIKDDCQKVFNIARSYPPPLGSHNAWTKSEKICFEMY